MGVPSRKKKWGFNGAYPIQWGFTYASQNGGTHGASHCQQTNIQWRFDDVKHMEVSWVIGLPPVIIHFNGIFPNINHPFGGTSSYGNPHMAKLSIESRFGASWWWHLGHPGTRVLGIDEVLHQLINVTNPRCSLEQDATSRLVCWPAICKRPILFRPKFFKFISVFHLQWLQSIMFSEPTSSRSLFRTRSHWSSTYVCMFTQGIP